MLKIELIFLVIDVCCDLSFELIFLMDVRVLFVESCWCLRFDVRILIVCLFFK